MRHHHEWYDGSSQGYPSRLVGDQIPLPSRIILVSDTVEAMTSDRPYRRGIPLERVVAELHRFSGTQFDPAAADAFLSGDSRDLLAQLFARLLESPGARREAAEVEEQLRTLDDFARRDVAPLRRALRALGRSGYVPGSERDALFIAARQPVTRARAAR